jgi:SAM-dependent methyltransferase
MYKAEGGHSMEEWFENERFWVDLYPFLFPENKFQAAFEEIEKIVALTGFQGKRVLDLCCGPGRHTVVLAKKGYTVTAVDRTPFLLKKAQELAQAEGVSVEWVLEDMRNFVRRDTYDLVLNLYTSFGYFDEKQDDLRVLQNIYASLKPGGVCVLELMGKEILARIFGPTSSEQLPDGSLIVQCHEIFDEWTRIRNDWILIKDGKATSFRFHHTIYSGQELKDRLLGVGLSKVRLFGSLDGEEYGLPAQRLIAAAVKAESSHDDHE